MRDTSRPRSPPRAPRVGGGSGHRAHHRPGGPSRTPSRRSVRGAGVGVSARPGCRRHRALDPARTPGGRAPRRPSPADAPGLEDPWCSAVDRPSRSVERIGEQAHPCTGPSRRRRPARSRSESEAADPGGARPSSRPFRHSRAVPRGRDRPSCAAAATHRARHRAAHGARRAERLGERARRIGRTAPPRSAPSVGMAAHSFVTPTRRRASGSARGCARFGSGRGRTPRDRR